MVAPASRFSNTADTGIRVSRNTHAPLSLPGTFSTAGHWDQSRVAMFFALLFLSTTVRRRCHTQGGRSAHRLVISPILHLAQKTPSVAQSPHQTVLDYRSSSNCC